MKKVYTAVSFKVLVAIVVFFLITALISAGNNYVNNFITSLILTPIQQLAAGTVDQVGKSLTPQKTREELELENSRLTEENRRLNDLLVNYYDIKRENEELEKFYSIKKENSDFSVLTSTVIGRDSNENFYGFTLDRGSNDGVELNAPVMTENGLVGWVSEVSPKSCKVTTILSPDAGIGAVAKRTDEGGIISGNAVSADNGNTRLLNISARHQLEKDDIIVTSGYGGVFPKNIRIGVIVEFSGDEYTGMPTAVIEPFEDIRTVSSVVIVTDFSTKGTIDAAAVKEDSEQKEKQTAKKKV